MASREGRLLEIEYKEGFTPKAAALLIFAAVVMLPAEIYMRLVAHPEGIPHVGFIALLLALAIVSFCGSSLTVQEGFIIYRLARVAGEYVIWLPLIYRLYFSHHPLVLAYGITPPDWWVPPVDLSVRTFWIHPWLKPVAVLLTSLILYELMNISLGFFMAYLFIEIERLPFPMQVVEAEVIKNLVRPTPSMMRIFSLVTVFAAGYYVILYGIPIVTRALIGTPLRFIPIPWWDASPLLGKVLPGAAFGVATDLISFAIGLVVPYKVVYSMLIGSLATYIVGNHLALKLKIPFTASWRAEYLPGMSLAEIYQRSWIDLWINPAIGLALAAGIAPLVLKPQRILGTLRGLARIPLRARRAGYIPLRTIIMIYLAASFGLVLLVHALVPGFPLLLLIFAIPLMSFVDTLLASRSIGLTGTVITIPYVRELTIVLSRYPHPDIWFAPLMVTTGAGWTAAIRMAQLTETKPISYVKAFIVAVALAWTFGLIYTSIFWKMAPIPSPAYPIPQIYWPVQVSNDVFWISITTGRGKLFRPGALFAGVALGFALQALEDFLHAPFSLIGIVWGVTTPPPYAVSTFIGGVLGCMMRRRYGEEWDRYRNMVVAGVACAAAIIGSLGAAIAMLAFSQWPHRW